MAAGKSLNLMCCKTVREVPSQGTHENKMPPPLFRGLGTQKIKLTRNLLTSPACCLAGATCSWTGGRWAYGATTLRLGGGGAHRENLSPENSPRETRTFPQKTSRAFSRTIPLRCLARRPRYVAFPCAEGCMVTIHAHPILASLLAAVTRHWLSD
jgi:hypothetical protein